MMHERPKVGVISRRAQGWGSSGAVRDLVAWLRRQAADQDGESHWYVVRTIRDSADIVAGELDRHGIRAWCPTKKAVKRLPRQRTKVEVEEPFYSRYFFVRLVAFEAAWLGVMTFDGVDCLLGNGERPTPIPERFIAKLQAPRAKGDVDRSRLLSKGDAALIMRGPFASFSGTVTEDEHDDTEIDIEIDIFGRMVPCRIGVDDLKKLT